MQETILVFVALFAGAFIYSIWEQIKESPYKKRRKWLKIAFWSFVGPLICIVLLIAYSLLNERWEQQTEVSKLGWLIFIGFAYILFLVQNTLKLWDERYAALLQGAEFRCNFTKKIFTSEEKKDLNRDFLELKRERIKLPFHPYIGLSIRDYVDRKMKEGEDGFEHEEGKDFYSGSIQSVHWDNSSQQFHCEVEPIVYQEDIRPEILYLFEKHGWKADFLLHHGKLQESYKEYKSLIETPESN